MFFIFLFLKIAYSSPVLFAYFNNNVCKNDIKLLGLVDLTKSQILKTEIVNQVSRTCSLLKYNR